MIVFGLLGAGGGGRRSGQRANMPLVRGGSIRDSVRDRVRGEGGRADVRKRDPAASTQRDCALRSCVHGTTGQCMWWRARGNEPTTSHLPRVRGLLIVGKFPQTSGFCMHGYQLGSHNVQQLGTSRETLEKR